MKRTTLLATVISMSMLLTGVNANAQRNERGRDRDRDRMEHRDDRRNDKRDNRYMHNGRKPQHRNDRYSARPKHRPQARPHGSKMVRCTPPSIRRGSYVPGWEGRVRHHHDGRWGYCVNGVWTYYDCYYNPYDFFCEPMPPRPVHHVPVAHVHHSPAGEVAAGIAAGTVIGCIIGALAN